MKAQMIINHKSFVIPNLFQYLIITLLIFNGYEVLKQVRYDLQLKNNHFK